MKLSSGLTKENFWNEIMNQYPNATKCFCDWIDEYKKAANWSQLFNESCHAAGKPKFHDIPYDMQVGIWIKFATDKLNELFEQPEYEYSGDLEEDIKTVFSEINDLEELND